VTFLRQVAAAAAAAFRSRQHRIIYKIYTHRILAAPAGTTRRRRRTTPIYLSILLIILWRFGFSGCAVSRLRLPNIVNIVLIGRVYCVSPGMSTTAQNQRCRTSTIHVYTAAPVARTRTTVHDYTNQCQGQCQQYSCSAYSCSISACAASVDNNSQISLFIVSKTCYN